MMEQGAFNDVAKKALEFRSRYYKMLDDPQDRSNVAGLYAPDVPMVCEWNGHPLSTVGDVRNYISALPKTSHQIDMVDAQPLPDNQDGDSFLLTVHGTVTYNDEHRREFYQRMIIRRFEQRYYILSDYYRWLSERSQ
ncbi:hypothetical protein CUR178_07560 [Leishmania enriettii]|uniref:NTF2-related export protein n=1 Tax=Leishmania enriettii TaxID=5663 RepID=A0A836HX75_LEIEN|nr:hypothetical protein CUR178_07560 [Leishmania enriettii]